MKWLIILLVSFTSFLFFIAIFQMVFMSDKRMKKRMKYFLQVNDQKKLSRKNFNVLVQMQMYNQNVQEKFMSKNKNKRLEVLLQSAGVPIKPFEYVIFQVISTIFIALLLFLVTYNVLFLLIGAVFGFMLPKWWIKHMQKKRIQKFNTALPDMITTLVGSLRAGFSFAQALQTVVEESDPPISDEIEITLREMQYGSTMEEALEELNARMPSEDLELMIQAIVIQRQIGGNLASILETIVSTIRERNKIQRQVQTLTAQGKLSGIVIGLLPVVLSLALYLIEPEYIGTLFTHQVGLMLVAAAVISGLIGLVLIRKMTTIEV